MKLTDSDARKALAVLMSQGRLKAAHVAAAIRAHDRIVLELRQRLAALEGRLALGNRRQLRADGQRRRQISAKRKAAMVRQGKYLAAVRRLSARDRARVKSVLASKGYLAAIQTAKRIAD
jgi:hypothetical protein